MPDGILDAQACYRALQSRDARFDGRFFVAVKTTGVYCRPVCTARTPRRENCTFLPCAAAAAEAGYRPCLRCRPEASPGTPAWQGTSATVSRALRLIGQGALDEGSVATLANPGGIEPHLAWLAAGSETPDLLRVADEWLGVDLFAWPASRLPPSPLAWMLVWGGVLVVAATSIRALRDWRQGRDAPDPALVGLSVAALVAMLTAVRFTWLGILPLLLVATLVRGVPALAEARARWALAGASVALVLAFLRFGDWPMISGGLSFDAARYARPYAVSKYVAHPIWVLRDAGVRGHLYVDYSLAGFAGYWLAPELRVFVNGSLNVPPRVMEANRAIREHRGLVPGQSLLELLDELEIDVFVGTGVPRVPESARPSFYTTAYLEDAPGWVRVFRNVESSIYVRRNERNRENLGRIAAFYREADVPWDEELGFDPARVIAEARPWAVGRGLVPIDFASLAKQSLGSPAPPATAARERLAGVYAITGLHAEAVRLDRRTLRRFDPESQPARRRLVWSLLHLGQRDEALEEAAGLLDDDEHPLARVLARSVAAYMEIADEEEAAGFLARMPLLSNAEAQWLTAGIVQPEIRAR